MREGNEGRTVRIPVLVHLNRNDSIKTIADALIILMF